MGKTKSASLSTLVVMIATFLSRLLGFVRNAIVGALFGQTWKADVLNVVFNIPMNLRKLMAEGALSTAFIPVLSQSLVDDRTGAKAVDLTRAIMSLQIVIILPLTILCIIFAEPIISVLAPFHNPDHQVLAVVLFRWFINYLFLISVTAVMMAVLNTHHHFAVSAISPVLFSISVILSLLAWYQQWDIYAQIPGVLGGGLAQVLFQYVSFRKLGYSLKPKIRFWTPELISTLKKWGPALSISGISLLNQQISMTLATTLDPGSASALNNAIVFWQLPAGVLSASVVTVFFPKMSRSIAEKDVNATSKTMIEGLELQALLLIPAGFLLAMFSQPMISIAYQRGLFTFQDSVLAAGVLSILSWGLFLSGMFNFLQRYFYAQNDFRTPFVVNIVWALSDAISSFVLMKGPLGVRGLAVGSVIGFAVGAMTLMVLAWKKLRLKELGIFGFFVLRVTISLVPCYFLLEQTRHFWGVWWKDGMNWASLGLLAAEGLLSILAIVLCLVLLGIRPWKFFRRQSV